MSSKNTKHRYTNSQVKNNTNRSGQTFQEDNRNYYMIPVFIILCIIPFIVQMIAYHTNLSDFIWFSSNDDSVDFFLYYKQWWFVATSAVIAIVIAIKVYVQRKSIRFSLIYIPLAIYALLALLSAIFSKYASFSFSGSYEQFESIWAILGYCLVAYYVYLIVDTERDIQRIIRYITVVAVIMSVLGIFQYLGYDFFATKFGGDLITPIKYRDGSGLDFTMGAHRVYLTLYNPNYVGVYTALITPVILILMFFQKKIGVIVASAFAVIGLIICTIGSQSLSGFISLGTAAFFMILFMWRYLWKRYYITLPLVLILLIGAIFYLKISDFALVNKFSNNIKSAKTEFNISDMQTKDDCVSLTYKGNVLNVYYAVNEDQTASFGVADDAGQVVAGTYDTNLNVLVLTDQRFTGIVLGADPQLGGVFYIQIDGVNWRFSNQVTEDHSYYYVNYYNKVDKMVNAEASVFKGYERFASNRGYIWSRTLPLVKKYVVLGSGPDTFTMVFPQQDYLFRIQSGLGGAILTKPHSMYLQMAVQTGLLSVIAFLTFYMMYFISSIRLYYRGIYKSLYAKVGVGILVGTISYMVVGLTNDSTITTAPIFWVLIGLGIAVNQKAKPLIMEEAAELKEKREIERKMKVEKQ